MWHSFPKQIRLWTKLINSPCLDINQQSITEIRTLDKANKICPKHVPSLLKKKGLVKETNATIELPQLSLLNPCVCALSLSTTNLMKRTGQKEPEVSRNVLAEETSPHSLSLILSLTLSCAHTCMHRQTHTKWCPPGYSMKFWWNSGWH